MPITYEPFRQGNNVDSWIMIETDDLGEVVSKQIIFEDPNKKSTIRDFEKLSTEDIATFKEIIGVTGGGGSVTLTSGEGIDVTDNGDGSYTISSTLRPTPPISLVSGANISIIDNNDGSYTISAKSGGSTTLLSGEGIDVTDNGDGSYTITSNTRLNLTAGDNITITSDPETGGNIISARDTTGIKGPHVLTQPRSGNGYSFNITNTGLTTTALQNGFMYLVPFIPAHSFTANYFEIEVTGAVAGANTRILMFGDRDGLPYDKLMESTNLDCSTIGFKRYNSIYNFVAGTTYWMCVHNGIPTPTVRAFQTGALLPIVGYLTSANTFYNGVRTNSYTLGSAPTTLSPAVLTAYNAVTPTVRIFAQ